MTVEAGCIPTLFYIWVTKLLCDEILSHCDVFWGVFKNRHNFVTHFFPPLFFSFYIPIYILTPYIYFYVTKF